jgi:hypothetical protein
MSTKGRTAIDGVDAVPADDAFRARHRYAPAATPRMITTIVSASSGLRVTPAARAVSGAVVDGTVTTDDPDCTARSNRVRSTRRSAAC